MNLLRPLLRRAFGRPQGVLGRLGGLLMARMNRACALFAIELLEPGNRERVLEIGFGSGVAIALVAERVSLGHVAGVDISAEMVAQASRRNRAAIAAGLVELRRGSAERLPFPDASFDKALAVNAMQLWPDAAAGLREVLRCLRPGGRLVLGFTPNSGRSPQSLPELLTAAGFAQARLARRGRDFCVTAEKP